MPCGLPPPSPLYSPSNFKKDFHDSDVHVDMLNTYSIMYVWRVTLAALCVDGKKGNFLLFAWIWKKNVSKQYKQRKKRKKEKKKDVESIGQDKSKVNQVMIVEKHFLWSVGWCFDLSFNT